MSKWWQSYKTKSRQKYNNASIAKDEVALLAERLEFFVPRFSNCFTLLEVILYIAGLTFLIVGLKATCQINGLGMVSWYETFDWQTLLGFYVLHLFSIILTTVPALFLIDSQRETLKTQKLFVACSKLIATMMFTGACAIITVLFSAKLLGFYSLTIKGLFFDLLLFEIFVISSTSVILVYYWRNHKALKALHLSFEQKLDRLNQHIQARLAPHFLFNTLNTLSSLIETDRDEANDMLQHVSHLMRTTFDEPTESSLEEELEICRHYLAIESYRLQDKLTVKWDLPDEDTLYDMSITSLTLQTVLEQTVLHVVEATTEPVYIYIEIKWENHIVNIEVSATTSKNVLIDHYDVANRINFRVQENYLQAHFGESANITMKCKTHEVISTICYKLHDALVS